MRRLIPAALLAIAALAVVSPSHAATAKAVPPPALDETGNTATTEVAVLAGGCFWGVQGVFQHVAGVTGAVSGYAGGDAATAHYDLVGTGQTGHAESVRVTFDPRRISYGRILQIYFSVAHDPTELNYQGPDRGTQYRSTIFPITQEQADIAKAYIAQLDQAHAFQAPVVTTIEAGRAFYPAEAYHQDFLARHPINPYIVYNDLPKIRELQRLFPDLYRADPVLVVATQ
ncbi:MAG TPA: peptide-methionine (S)-S-oxide reductase MsrA [Acetobacteraceae bacterium]|jgi:peptide-methionine (S)-S-oxide reductase